MINITTTTEADPDAWKKDREPIFAIDGTEYTVPRIVPTNVALKATRRVADLGEVAGGVWLMTMMLGQKGWDALEGCADPKPEDLQAVQEIIRQKVFGAMEDQGKD